MSLRFHSSNTYPSAEGSDVHRSSSFWSLPTLVSSPACSVQSMVTNISSQPDVLNYSVLVQYPSQTLQNKILDEFSKWFIETLYSKLLAVEEVWCKMEEMTASLADSKIEARAANVCMQAALEHVTAVMEAQRLLLDVVVYAQAGGRVKWTLFMDGDIVFQGEAESNSDVLCAAFFKTRRDSLKHMPDYSYHPRKGQLAM